MKWNNMTTFHNHSNSKGDILFVHTMKAYMTSKGMASLILDSL